MRFFYRLLLPLVMLHLLKHLHPLLQVKRVLILQNDILVSSSSSSIVIAIINIITIITVTNVPSSCLLLFNFLPLFLRPQEETIMFFFFLSQVSFAAVRKIKTERK